MTGALLLLFAVAAIADDERIAVWRGGEVSAATFESWLVSRRADDSAAERLSQVERMLSVLVLAEAAEGRGVADSQEFSLLMASVEESLLAAELRHHRSDTITVTEAELDELQGQYPDAFQKPDRRLIRILFKRKSVDATQEETELVRTELERLRQQVLDGASFADLATEHSDSQSRFRRGSIGFVTPGDLPPALEEVAWSLSPGEVSAVLEGAQGFTLVYLDRIGPPKTPSRAEVRSMFASNLRRLRIEEDWSAFETNLWEAASPRIRPEAVSGPRVLAEFAGGVVRRADLQSALEVNARKPARVEDLPPVALTQQIESLVKQKLCAREARRLGLDSTSDFENRLSWRRDEALAIDELAFRVHERLQRPQESELEDFFRSNRSRFVKKAEYEISIVRIEYPPDDSEELRTTDQLARQLVARVRSGEMAFEEAALEYSSDASASEGGYLGWVPKPQLALLSTRLGREVIELSAGEITPEVEDQGSYWFALLHASRPGRLLTFDEARPAVEQRVGNLKVQELKTEIEGKLREGLEVELVASPADAA